MSANSSFQGVFQIDVLDFPVNHFTSPPEDVIFPGPDFQAAHPAARV